MKLSISLNRIMFFGRHSIEWTPSIEFSVLKIYIFPIQMRTLKHTIRPGRHYQRLCPPLNYTSVSRHACIHLLASLALSSSSLFLSRARIYARSHRVYIERGRAVLFLLAPLSLSLSRFLRYKSAVALYTHEYDSRARFLKENRAALEAGHRMNLLFSHRSAVRVRTSIYLIHGPRDGKEPKSYYAVLGDTKASFSLTFLFCRLTNRQAQGGHQAAVFPLPLCACAYTEKEKREDGNSYVYREYRL